MFRFGQPERRLSDSDQRTLVLRIVATLRNRDRRPGLPDRQIHLRDVHRHPVVPLGDLLLVQQSGGQPPGDLLSGQTFRLRIVPTSVPPGVRDELHGPDSLLIQQLVQQEHPGVVMQSGELGNILRGDGNALDLSGGTHRPFRHEQCRTPQRQLIPLLSRQRIPFIDVVQPVVGHVRHRQNLLGQRPELPDVELVDPAALGKVRKKCALPHRVDVLVLHAVGQREHVMHRIEIKRRRAVELVEVRVRVGPEIYSPLICGNPQSLEPIQLFLGLVIGLG